MSDLLIKLATPITVVLGTLALLVYNFLKDKDGVDDRLITNYEKLDRQQKEQLAEKDIQIAKYQTDMAEIKASMGTLKESFAKETGKLQGQLDAKDKELDSLRATILDPNLNLGKILTEIHGFMEKLTESNVHQVNILEGQIKREIMIDERDKNLTPDRTN